MSTNPNAPGIYTASSKNITFDNLYLHGVIDGNADPDGGGLIIRNTSYVTVMNSKLTELFAGIGASYSDHLNIVNNDISVTKADAMQFASLKQVYIGSNIIHDLQSSLGGLVHKDGIQFFTAGTKEASVDITIVNNTIMRGDGDPVQGIFMSNESQIPYQNVVITGNAIVGQQYHGIAIDNAVNAQISDNYVVGNKDMPSWILLVRSSDSSITNNIATAYIVNSDTNVVQTDNVTAQTTVAGDISGFLTWLQSHPDSSGVEWLQEHSGSIVTEESHMADLQAVTKILADDSIITKLIGSQFNDTLTGNAHNNILVGGAGNDTLNGAGGNDTLTGGLGSDQFIIGAHNGADTITDFQHNSPNLNGALPSIDKIHLLSDTGITSFGMLHTSVTNGNTVIDFGNGDNLTVVGVTNLTASDFVFDAKPVVVEPPPVTDPGTGTSSNAHEITVHTQKELLAAVQKAQAGDVIKLAAGNYGAVNLWNINKTGDVIIQSADKDHAAVFTSLNISNSSHLYLQGVEALGTNPNAATIYVGNSKNLTFDGIDLHGVIDGNVTADGGGLIVRQASDITIKNSDFNELQAAIGVSVSNNITIDNNHIGATRGDGMQFANVNHIEIAGNLFTNSQASQGLSGHKDGIEFFTASFGASKDITITDNTFLHGTGDAMQAIVMGADKNNHFENVVISHNAIVGEQHLGIEVNWADHLDVSDNYVVGNNASAIQITNVEDATTTNNVASSYYIKGATQSGNTTTADFSGYAQWIQTHPDSPTWTSWTAGMKNTNADTYTFDKATAFNSVETINNFNVSEGDKIDIHNVLEGYNPATDAIADFVHMTSTADGVALQVDKNGGHDAFVTIASIHGMDTHLTMDDLIAKGNLVT